MPLVNPALLQPLLGRHVGRFDVDALSSCDSTSSELMRRAAAGAPAGTVIVADQQSAGRGRRGRIWLSSPQDSLTFSLFWRLPAGQTPAGLSLAVGVALAKALEQLGVRGVRLKWPNDVLLLDEAGGFAKLAGILVELSSDRRGLQVFIGIGLNFRPPAEALAQPVAGLAQGVREAPERHAVLAGLLVALADALDCFAATGFAGLREDWLVRHAWQDCPVCLADGDVKTVGGICRGVDEDGALLLEVAGELRRVLAGDVSLRLP